MATLAGDTRPTRGDHGFFFASAVAMAGIVVLGFGMQWLMGRSTFRAPAVLHLHALVFMGAASWVLQRNGHVRVDIASTLKKDGKGKAEATITVGRLSDSYRMVNYLQRAAQVSRK
mgnify:CR=1 FL=1